MTCHKYVKGQVQSIIPTFIEVIDDEDINTKVLEKLEYQFNMLYELQKLWGVNDDEDIIRQTAIVCKQIVAILDDNRK